jgi:hypothetical protein
MALGVGLSFWAGCGNVKALNPRTDAGGDGNPADAAGAGGEAGAQGGGGASGAGGGGVCNVLCMTGRACCGGGCVNPQNDPMNCGQCGVRCDGANPLCSGGTCRPAPCSPSAGVCPASSICCGNACCAAGDLCCEADGPVSGGPPTCLTPTAAQSTCPQGCAPLCVSDRNQKKDIVPIDPSAILDKVSRLPISTWSYRHEAASVRHLGPMAQDFRAAFGLGDDDRTYFAVDAHGVALAAIQALDGVVSRQQKQIEALTRLNRALSRRLSAIEAARTAGPRPAAAGRQGGARPGFTGM